MITRRALLGLAAAVPVAGGTRAAASTCDTPSLSSIPVRRTGKVEIAFKSPGPQPNGLQATPEGLWIIDQSAGSRASLVRYADGEVLRSFETDTVRPSGITFDGEALWIGSTFSYENVRCHASTGAVLERRPTPGSTTFSMAGDPPPRRSPLAGTPMAQARPVVARQGQAQLFVSLRNRASSFKARTARSGGTAGCGRRRRLRARSSGLSRRSGSSSSGSPRRGRDRTASRGKGAICGTGTGI